jgi:hypothetical protein
LFHYITPVRKIYIHTQHVYMVFLVRAGNPSDRLILSLLYPLTNLRIAEQIAMKFDTEKFY